MSSSAAAQDSATQDPATQDSATQDPADPVTAAPTAGAAGQPGASMLEASGWRDMFRLLVPHRGAVVLGAVLSLVSGLVALAQPLVAKWIVDALEARESVLEPLVLLTAIVVGAAVVGAWSHYVLARIAESVVLDTRRSVVRRILRLRMSEVGRFPPGDLMARATSDTALLREALSQTLVDALRGVVLLLAIAAMMYLMDPVLLLVTAGVLVAASLLIGVIIPYFQRYSRKVQEAVADLNAVLERALGAFRTIKASGSEPGEAAAMDRANRQAYSYGLKLARLGGVVGGVALLAIHVSYLVVLGVGAARVVSGAIPISTLIAFLLYLFALIEPVAGLIGAGAGFSTGVAAVRRVRDVTDLAVEPIDLDRDPRAAPARHTRPATVEFRDVRFRYPGPDTALVHDGVDFAVPPLGMTALVGPSGAGKSTVFALIERFYRPESGRVLLDGRDVGDWSLDQLRATIGYVEQDAPILAGTLRENLLLGVGEVEPDRLREVLVRCRLAALVDALPAGVDSPVGHRGSSLSGGERQRVAIARALLRRPRLLLLDEATSQLDAVNEAALRETVSDLARELTVLVVAHRLSTVVRADRILVMDNGRIRAAGGHAELLDGDELYRELASVQLLTSVDSGDDPVG
ncbi:ABC transporter ATP-binding protein [Actinosynnema sp. NPDC023587]|uniref:ABC transporter ATP-binding protein n=1 Tax=Actinosynnema sp. NPDC023587 TaxID=3154695 RepID=UPI003409E65D